MAAIVGKLREFWINSSGWKTVRFTAEKQAKVTELHRDRALCSGRMKMFTEEILFIVKLQKKKQPKAANNLGFYFLSVKLRVFSVSASRSAVHMETHVRVWRLLSVFNSKLTIRTILHP